MMFGDYGHGSLIFFAGLMLTMFYNQLKNTAVAPILAGRYFMLAMGMCSMYNGLLYNEFFAIPNDWFGTCFDVTVRNDTLSTANGGNFVYNPIMPNYYAPKDGATTEMLARDGLPMDFIWQPVGAANFTEE
jgi:vacuolar-type H+-ATPase subunit I/STV1